MLAYKISELLELKRNKLGDVHLSAKEAQNIIAALKILEEMIEETNRELHIGLGYIQELETFMKEKFYVTKTSTNNGS